MKLPPLILFCLLLLSGFAGASSLTLEKAVLHLDPSIQSVMMCGEWHNGREQGTFRIIHGWLWGHTELYVQWLAAPVWYPEKGQEERPTPIVRATAIFDDFDHYESAIDLDNILCLEQEGMWMITAEADNANEDNPEKASYRIRVHLSNEPGKFKIEKLYGSGMPSVKSKE